MKSIPVLLLIAILFSVQNNALGQASGKGEVGYAVYYADYLDGRKTSNGEIYRKNQYTCAHKVHPFGTLLRVTRLDNGKSVRVRVNDRGPFGEGLAVDLSRIAASDIGLLRDGKTRVSVEVAGFSQYNPKPAANTRELASSYRRSEGYSPNPYSNRSQQQPANPGPASYGNDVFTAKSGNTSYPNIYRSQSVTDSRNRNSRNTGGYATDLSRRGSVDNTPTSYDSDGITFGSSPRNNPSVSGIAIQLGAFTNASNATRQLNSIRNQGLNDAYIVQRRSGNKTFNKIVVGPFNNRSDAQIYLQNTVRNRFRLDGYIIGL